MLASKHKLNPTNPIFRIQIPKNRTKIQGNHQLKEKCPKISQRADQLQNTKEKLQKPKEAKTLSKIFGIFALPRGFEQDPVEDNPLKSSTNKNHRNYIL